MTAAEIFGTGRSGALTTYKIVGDPKTLKLQILPNIPGTYPREFNGTQIVGTCNSSEFDAIDRICESVSNEATKRRIAERNHGAPKRVVVRAGSVNVGDVVGGYEVTGLGTTWRPDADQPSALGFRPDWTLVQYAYFS